MTTYSRLGGHAGSAPHASSPSHKLLRQKKRVRALEQYKSLKLNMREDDTTAPVYSSCGTLRLAETVEEA